jgi:hypothetical protein
VPLKLTTTIIIATLAITIIIVTITTTDKDSLFIVAKGSSSVYAELPFCLCDHIDHALDVVVLI